jgi:hypothetical protein
MRWPLRTYLFRGGTWLALVVGASFASLSLLVFSDGDSNLPSGIALPPGAESQATSTPAGDESAPDGGLVAATTPSSPGDSVATLAQVAPADLGSAGAAAPTPGAGGPTPGGGEGDGGGGGPDGDQGGSEPPPQSPPDNPTPKEPPAKPPTPAPPPASPPRDDDGNDDDGECKPDHDDHDWDDDDHDWDDDDDRDDESDHGNKGGNGNHYGWDHDDD